MMKKPFIDKGLSPFLKFAFKVIEQQSLATLLKQHSMGNKKQNCLNNVTITVNMFLKISFDSQTFRLLLNAKIEHIEH